MSPWIWREELLQNIIEIFLNGDELKEGTFSDGIIKEKEPQPPRIKSRTRHLRKKKARRNKK